MMRDHMELVGLPGAGKSTLVEFLTKAWANATEAEDLSISSPEPVTPTEFRKSLISLSARLFFRAPGTTVSLFREEDGKMLIRRLAYRLAGVQQSHIKTPAVHVNSGVLQPLVTFATEDSDLTMDRSDLWHSTLNASLATLPPPAVLIYVSAPASVAQRRFVSRGRRVTAWGKEVADDRMTERFKAGEATCERIRQDCEARGSTVFVVDSSAPFEETMVHDLMTTTSKILRKKK
jgi:hypothetical protein